MDALDAGSGGGDHVLHHQDALALVQIALDLLPGPVVLLLLADHDEREASLKSQRGLQGNRSEHDAGDPVGLDAVLADLLRHQAGDEAQDLRVRAGLLDVDVVVALGAGGEGELAELQRSALLQCVG